MGSSGMELTLKTKIPGELALSMNSIVIGSKFPRKISDEEGSPGDSPREKKKAAKFSRAGMCGD
jgi:hypothetical protein